MNQIDTFLITSDPSPKSISRLESIIQQSNTSTSDLLEIYNRLMKLNVDERTFLQILVLVYHTLIDRMRMNRTEEFPPYILFWKSLLKYSRHPFSKIRLYSIQILFLLYEELNWTFQSDAWMMEFALGFASLDIYPRVRCVSISYITRHLKDYDDCNKYMNQVREWLNDTEDEDTLIHIISFLGALYHTFESPSSAFTQSKRDVIFLYLCTLGNHPFKQVRLQAFRVLKNLNMITPSLLVQSLDKNPIQETIEYKSSPGLGVFVHGLEDEFKCIRLAALEAIGSQCCKNIDQRVFVTDAIELILDMLNDETLEIFNISLECLLNIGNLSRIYVNSSLLQPILPLLFHDTPNARVLKFLTYILISDLSSFQLLIQSLVSLVKRTKDISLEMYELLVKLGENHPNLVNRCSDTLLDIEKTFVMYSKLTWKDECWLLLYHGAYMNHLPRFYQDKVSFILYKYGWNNSKHVIESKKLIVAVDKFPFSNSNRVYRFTISIHCSLLLEDLLNSTLSLKSRIGVLDSISFNSNLLHPITSKDSNYKVYEWEIISTHSDSFSVVIQLHKHLHKQQQQVIETSDWFEI